MIKLWVYLTAVIFFAPVLLLYGLASLLRDDLERLWAVSWERS